MSQSLNETYLSNPVDATIESVKRLTKYDLKVIMQIVGITFALIVVFFGTFGVIMYNSAELSSGVLVALLCIALLFCFSLGALTISQIKVITDSMAGKTTPLVPLLKLGARKLFPFIILSLLYGLMIAGGLLLLILPGIYLAVRFSLVQYVMLAEDKGIIESFKRAGALSKGHMWEIAGAYCVTGIFSLLAGVILSWSAYQIALSNADISTIVINLVLLLIGFGIISFAVGVVGYAAVAFRYHQISGLDNNPTITVKTHTLNYIVPCLFLIVSFIFPSPTDEPYSKDLVNRYPELKPLLDPEMK